MRVDTLKVCPVRVVLAPPSGAAYSASYSASTASYYIVSREAYGSNYWIKSINSLTGAVSYVSGAYGRSLTTSRHGDLFVANAAGEIWGPSGKMTDSICSGGPFVPATTLGRNLLAYGYNYPTGGTLWAIGSDGQVYGIGSAGGCWTKAELPAGLTAYSISINYDIPKVSGGPTIYNRPVVVVNSTNAMYDYTGSAWESFHGGSGLSTGVAEWYSKVEVIGTNQRFWHWAAASNGFVQDAISDGTAYIYQIVNVSPNGSLYTAEEGAFVDNYGQLWHWTDVFVS